MKIASVTSSVWTSAKEIFQWEQYKQTAIYSNTHRLSATENRSGSRAVWETRRLVHVLKARITKVRVAGWKVCRVEAKNCIYIFYRNFSATSRFKVNYFHWASEMKSDNYEVNCKYIQFDRLKFNSVKKISEVESICHSPHHLNKPGLLLYLRTASKMNVGVSTLRTFTRTGWRRSKPRKVLYIILVSENCKCRLEATSN